MGRQKTERVSYCGTCCTIPCSCGEIARLTEPRTSPPSEVERLRTRIATLEAALSPLAELAKTRRPMPVTTGFPIARVKEWIYPVPKELIEGVVKVLEL